MSHGCLQTKDDNIGAYRTCLQEDFDELIAVIAGSSHVSVIYSGVYLIRNWEVANFSILLNPISCTFETARGEPKHLSLFLTPELGMLLSVVLYADSVHS